MAALLVYDVYSCSAQSFQEGFDIFGLDLACAKLVELVEGDKACLMANFDCSSDYVLHLVDPLEIRAPTKWCESTIRRTALHLRLEQIKNTLASL